MRLTTKLLLAAGASLLLAGPGSARDNERRYTYACEVQTEAGVAGLVMVQANAMEDARAAAGRAMMAHTIGGESSPAMSVVECIETPGGEFRDSQFQRFYELLPK